MTQAWEVGGERTGGAYAEEERSGHRAVPTEPPDPDRCPFCHGGVEHGWVLWNAVYPLVWRGAGARSSWDNERLRGRPFRLRWWTWPRGQEAHRCRSCRRLWFDPLPGR